MAPSSSSHARAFRRSPLRAAALEALEGRRLLTAYTLTSIPFTTVPMGENPTGGVVMDSAGNLYGTTANGGQGFGTVFKIAPGSTTITTLATFSRTDGSSPRGTLLLLDGVLYGTASQGGLNNAGSAFKVNVDGSGGIVSLGSLDGLTGSATYTGSFPQGGLTVGPDGRLYGTATNGGLTGGGTVFSVSKSGGDLAVVGQFDGTNGATPDASLLLSGNTLIGTAEGGGYLKGSSPTVFTQSGTIFTVGGGSGVSEVVPFQFDGSTGVGPTGGVIADASGNLYGVAARSTAGGVGDGTVFRYDAASQQLTAIVKFDGTNGKIPQNALTLGPDGRLYGTTMGDGTPGAGVQGTIFSVNTDGSDFQTLYTFSSAATDGLQPSGPLLIDSAGNVYDTTLGGGPDGGQGFGTVFKLSPVDTATHLVFSSVPATGTAGNALAPAVTVSLEDADDRVVTSDTSSVTLSLNGSGATLGGTLTVAAVNGVATFSAVSVSAPGTYTLTATDGALASATSTPITVAGGDTGNGGLTPAIVSSKVPSAIVAGAKFKGSLKLSLANASGADEKGYTLKVFASTDAILDSSDASVLSLPGKGTVKAGKSGNATVNLTALPASLPNGSYFLIVQAVDAAGHAAFVSTGSTLTVAAPFVSLTETVTTTLPARLVSGAPAKGNITVVATNNGNIASAGDTALLLSASTTAGQAGSTVATLSKKVTIQPGKSAKVSVPVKSIPALADGNYFIVAEVTDPMGGTSVASTANAIAVAAPFVALAGTLGPISKPQSGDTLTLTNNGNVDDSSALTAIFGFSTDAAGTQPAGQTVTAATKKVTLKSGKPSKLRFDNWSAILSGLTPGQTYYFTVKVTDVAGNSTTAVSTTSFTL